MHPGPGRLQHIHRPVPAVGGLQHHLRTPTRPGDHLDQPVSAVDDPHRLQHLPSLRHPHQHTTSPMQINPHKLLTCVPFHQGPPSSYNVSTPSIPPGNRHEERRP